MRRIPKTLWFILLLTVIGAAAYQPAVAYWKERNKPKWRFAEVAQGRIVSVVNSTGSVKPVQTVHIGSFLSGPIDQLFADFNQEVKKGELLAKIDPRLYQSNRLRDEAQLLTRQADVLRVQALLQQATNEEKRALALREENERFISQAEIDLVKFNRMSFEAQLSVAKATVQQAEAALENSLTQLQYAEITSPVDGIIIDRKADPGQTLAAQFQTPELFTIGVNMRGKMHIFASVDEADIGLIRQAKERGRNAEFSVDAYPDDLFQGDIEEIRFSSTTTQNVVTYPVVVAAENPELKLLPGMTASISFVIDEREDVVKIPNSALRFFPLEKYVREQDRKLLEVSDTLVQEETENRQRLMSAQEKNEVRRNRNTRHVWIFDGESLKAVEVVIGLSDSRFSELIEGDLTPGQKLVLGIEPKGTTNRKK